MKDPYVDNDTLSKLIITMKHQAGTVTWSSHDNHKVVIDKNPPSLLANSIKMSSKEIAELTGKLPKHVNRDIKTMVEKLDGPVLDHEQYQEVKDSRGYVTEVFLDKELTMTLLTGYNVKLRNRVVKRWLELEAEVAAPKQYQVPKSFHEALLLAADLEKQVQDAKMELSVTKPFFEATIRTPQHFTLTHVHHLLSEKCNVKQKEFFDWCVDKSGYFYRYKSGAIAPTKKARDEGIAAVKLMPMKDGEKAITRSNTYITGKGVATLIEKYLK